MGHTNAPSSTPHLSLSCLQSNNMESNIILTDRIKTRIPSYGTMRILPESTKNINLPVTSPFCQQSPSSHIIIFTDLGAPYLIVNNWTDYYDIDWTYRQDLQLS